MRLLVTGAAGMLGQDIVRAAEAAGHDTVGLARDDADITDLGAIEAAVRANDSRGRSQLRCMDRR